MSWVVVAYLVAATIAAHGQLRAVVAAALAQQPAAAAAHVRLARAGECLLPPPGGVFGPITELVNTSGAISDAAAQYEVAFEALHGNEALEKLLRVHVRAWCATKQVLDRRWAGLSAFGGDAALICAAILGQPPPAAIGRRQRVPAWSAAVTRNNAHGAAVRAAVQAFVNAERALRGEEERELVFVAPAAAGAGGGGGGAAAMDLDGEGDGEVEANDAAAVAADGDDDGDDEAEEGAVDGDDEAAGDGAAPQADEARPTGKKGHAGTNAALRAHMLRALAQPGIDAARLAGYEVGITVALLVAGIKPDVLHAGSAGARTPAASASVGHRSSREAGACTSRPCATPGPANTSGTRAEPSR